MKKKTAGKFAPFEKSKADIKSDKGKKEMKNEASEYKKMPKKAGGKKK